MLLVEDSEDVRETTVEFINEVGFDVVAVETAEAALEALAAARYDIVFTDISLPGMSGIDLLKRRARPIRTAVVIASGYGGDFGRLVRSRRRDPVEAVRPGDPRAHVERGAAAVPREPRRGAVIAVLWVKSLHVIFVVSWFAGLFYLPRLFINIAIDDDAAARRGC